MLTLMKSGGFINRAISCEAGVALFSSNSRGLQPQLALTKASLIYYATHRSNLRIQPSRSPLDQSDHYRIEAPGPEGLGA